MNFTDILENPNYWLVAPVAMLDLPLAITSFLKEDGVSYYTVNEVIALGGHTVERFTVDGTKFMKGFCISMDTVDEIRAMISGLGLVYKTDIYFLTVLGLQEELAKVEWSNGIG